MVSRIGEDRLLNLSFGLAGVRRAEPLQHLPEMGATPAVDTRPVQQLDTLFERPSIEDVLDQASAPEIDDPNTLVPYRFAAALSDAHDLLAGLATDRMGADKAIFADALLVLEQVQADRAILDDARRALTRA